MLGAAGSQRPCSTALSRDTLETTNRSSNTALPGHQLSLQSTSNKGSPFFSGKLDQSSNSSGALGALADTLVEWICCEAMELLHALVGCLMVAAHLALHIELGLISNKGSKTPAVLGALSNEAMISFHVFTLLQPTEETPSQALHITAEPTGERTLNVDDVSALDASCLVLLGKWQSTPPADVGQSLPLS